MQSPNSHCRTNVMTESTSEVLLKQHFGPGLKAMISL